MSLIGKWFLTPNEAVDVASAEHVDFAIATMLVLNRKYAPHTWNNSGVPRVELDAALERGADPKAIEFLERGKDARLWVVKEYGWIRTTKNKWDVWEFDDSVSEIALKSKTYWRSQYSMNQWDMLDIHELKNGCRYSINLQKFLEGGKPEILKNLATGSVECLVEKSPSPEYSTSKYTERERDRLYARTGANPKRKVR